MKALLFNVLALKKVCTPLTKQDLNIPPLCTANNINFVVERAKQVGPHTCTLTDRFA